MDIKQFIILKSIVSSSDSHVDDDTNKFIKDLAIESIPFSSNVFFIASGGTEGIFLNTYKEYKPPYYLIATTSNNSLPAALEILSFLHSKNIEGYLLHGNSKEVRKQLLGKIVSKDSFNYSMKANSLLLKDKRFGVIGKPSDWLIASNVNYEEVKERCGASLIDISFKEFKSEIGKVKKVEIGRFKKYINSKINIEEIKKALVIYEALSVLIKKYMLDGITVRCFDLLGSVHSTSCLALAMLNDEGYICSCEGDIPALLTMAFINKYFCQSSFQCNPSYVNLVSNYAYLAHCTLPLNMTDDYSFDTHFESGIGIGIVGKMKKDKITILKINQNLTKYSVFAGKICENLCKNNLCRTQIKVEFDTNIDRILTSPCGNHLIVFYGEHEDEVISLLS